MSEPAVQPRLSILIVSWNVPEMLAACLRSIQQTAGDLRFEVIVVDNASTEDVPGMLERDFPWVRLIRNRENAGFPRANNQALAVARGQYVLFLNPDTEVGPGTLEGCVNELERDPQLGVVGTRLVLPDGSIQLEGGRNTYHLRHLLSESLYLHMLFPRSRWFGDYLMGWWDHTDVRDVEGLAGAFMMAPRDLALQLGGLPEDLFMYHEDASFCLRVLRSGRRIRYRGDLHTLHHSQQSSRRSPLRLDLLKTECRLLLLREADGRAAAAVGRFVWALASLPRLLVSLAGPLLPGVARRYPRVFDPVTHARQFAWCVAPWLLSRWLPRPPAEPLLPFSAVSAT